MLSEAGFGNRYVATQFGALQRSCNPLELVVHLLVGITIDCY